MVGKVPISVAEMEMKQRNDDGFGAITKDNKTGGSERMRNLSQIKSEEAFRKNEGKLEAKTFLSEVICY